MKRRVGVYGLLGFVLLALLADLLASDLPLLTRHHGKLTLLPCLFTPAGWEAQTVDSLRSSAEPGDWLIATPVGFGPESSDLKMAQCSHPSTARHPLGTDMSCRDVLARLIHGTRPAVTIGSTAVLLASLLGLGFGLLAGAGKVGRLVAGQFIDAAFAFPVLYLLLLWSGFSGVPSMIGIAVALALGLWPHTARLVRAEVFRTLGEPHIAAARSLGVSRTTLVIRHILPLTWRPIQVGAALTLGYAVLYESGLSFLGFGLPPPTASWGQLLAEAQAAGLQPWLFAPPVMMLTLLMVSSSLAAEK